MAKKSVLAAIEWADWDSVEPISPIPLTKAIFTPYLATKSKSELPQPPNHDHGIDDLDSDPPTSDSTEESATRTPAHTPEWTNSRESDPGRTLTEQDAGDAAARKVSLIISGQLSAPVLWNDDEDVDLGDLGNLADPTTDDDGSNNDNASDHRAGHGILIDFEDDALNIDDVLEHAFAPETGPDDDSTEPNNVETPSDPEPPVPHAMAQFILIVGMADAPSDDPGLDDGGIAATAI